ncbi:hypothetical protein [Cupriavidus basilensis]|uniref:hypothetical protein n=1 Tax=Cupriavidus basilensis TaxID=68895 RepID=UPI001300C236|nr:hypothetical protein [Cupriavidus basilensis]
MAVPATTFLLGACATTSYQRNDYKPYVVGREATTSTGSVMFFDQNGCAVSPDGWKTAPTMSNYYYRKERICSGASGTAIGPNYREFRQGYAAQARYQGVKYDLAQSRTVQVQNFTQDILAADASRSSTWPSANALGRVWGHTPRLERRKCGQVGSPKVGEWMHPRRTVPRELQNDNRYSGVYPLRRYSMGNCGRDSGAGFRLADGQRSACQC